MRPDATAPETLAVRLAAATVVTTTEVDALIPWLREALVPPFAEVAGGGAAPQVVVLSTPADASPASPAEMWPCYALGERVVSLPGRRAGAAIVVADAHFGAQFTVEPGRVEIRPRGAPQRLRPAAFRAVRELALPRGAEGSVELHAAAVEIGGHVVALAGPKRAGKTTTLAHIAASVDSAIIANDRLLLERSGSRLRVLGIPTFVSVRTDTVARLASVFGNLGELKHRLDHTLAELRALPSLPRAVEASSSYGFTPAQFAATVGSRLRPGGPLACLAFLSVDSGVDRFAVHPLRGAGLAGRLAECMRATEADATPTVFERCLGFETIGSGGSIEAPELAERVRCLEVRVGRRFLDDAEPARELTARLLEQGCEP